MPSSIAPNAPLATLTLVAGSYSAQIVPSAGALVAALGWRHPDGRSLPLLHAPRDATPGVAQPNRFGCWAMLPFANRAFGSVVDDGVDRFAVPANDPAGTIHGFGWQAAWSVEAAESDRVTLSHTRTEGPDPYRYRATQAIMLDADGMTVEIAIENRANRALPYGFGLHPWFDCAADTRLTLKAGGALVLGESYRATGSTRYDAGGPYADGPVFRSDRETALSLVGWDGVARIETSSRGLAVTLTADGTLRCPVVWAPAGADFLGVEPQSHGIGAPSEAAAREATPLMRLAPGERLEGRIRISAESVPQRALR